MQEAPASLALVKKAMSLLAQMERAGIGASCDALTRMREELNQKEEEEEE